MLPESFLFCIGLIIFAAIVFLLIYYILIFADIESDYLLVNDSCKRLNFWVIPKFGAHAILCFFLLLGGHWVMVALNAPMVIWLGLELYRIRRDSLGVYDPVDIFSRGHLKVYLRNCLIYLGYYFTMFFIYLYCFISSLLKGDPIRRHENDEIITEF